MGGNSVWRMLVAVATWQLTAGQTNLLINPSFEDELSGSWQGNGFTFERVTTDAVDGTYSAKCSGRDRDVEGPLQQDIPFLKGRHYVFEGYAKLLNEKAGTIWQSYKVIVQMDLPDQANKQTYIIAYRAFVTKAQGWIRVNGSIEAPMKDPSNAKLSFRGPDPGVDFLVDDFKFYEVEENPFWRQEADANIENFRKANIALNVAIPSGVPAQDVDVEVSLKKHLFGFGAKIEEFELGLHPKTMYERIYNSWFNWATVQAYKWKFSKGERYDPDFSRATDATEVLLANGKTVRAHSILWDIKKNTPPWVIALRDDEVRPEISKHISYMMNLTKGKVAQWDVQNEHIHGHYYEERLQDPTISKNAYRQAKAEDPNGPVLYLNDFTCVTSGASTEDYYELAMEYLNEGVPVEGLGIQGHTKEFVKPDPTAMWRRLDRLAETGLDLMMTEFDIGWPDIAVRADWLEDSIRAFFGHPGLKGVIMWGFWNGSMRDPDHELVLGPNPNELTILESGERWACLTKKEWTTKETFNMATSPSPLSVRGFKGDYEVIVKVQSVPVQRETFTLGDGEAIVDIAVTDSNIPIELTEEEDFVPECISHREEAVVASATTSSLDEALTCRTVKSAPSGTAEDDAASVTCEADEVMTSCNSYHMLKQSDRKGEEMNLNAGGQMECTAYNGKSSISGSSKGKGKEGNPSENGKKKVPLRTNSRGPPGKDERGRVLKENVNGVRAVARCCKVAGLKCDYKTAGPSLVFKGAMAEARCSSDQFAFGCSAYQPFPDSNGVKPNDNVDGCLAQSGTQASSNSAERSGAYSYAACCSATSTLECMAVASSASKQRSGASAIAVCPDGFTMTGCNVFAADGKPAGAKIDVPRKTQKVTCKAYLGASLPRDAVGVKSYATCCRVAP
ncbi:uncharacterized protein [Littorina saxatilis]|uniref:GH10 domain-containing protein n=1 Tax=Littorina saxatilis TaxID=31220 RepID=A0AAN9GR29_9CAEN